MNLADLLTAAALIWAADRALDALEIATGHSVRDQHGRLVRARLTDTELDALRSAT